MTDGVILVSDAIIDKFAAGGGVQPSRLVVTICRDDRYASSRLNVSSVQDRTLLRCTRLAPHHGAHLAAGGQKPKAYTAANQA
jgi:hypothetical protein